MNKMKKYIIMSLLMLSGCVTPIIDDGGDGDDKHKCNSNHYSSFLFDNAGTRVMNILSYQKSDNGFKETVARCKANGDTCIYLYLANAGDGNPPKTSFYINDQHAGTIDANKMEMIKNRLQYCRDQGLCVVAWLFPDDSSSITRSFNVDGQDVQGHSSLNPPSTNSYAVTRASFDKQFKYIDDIVANLNDLICEYCMGIELNEYFNDSQVSQLVNSLKSKSGKRVGVHWTPGRTSICGADALYYQYGFGLNASQIKSTTKSKKASLPSGIRFIAAEYAKSSDKEGRALGQAALQGGADGVGNGH